MALRCSAQHPSRGAVTRLSYPEAPGFPRCRPRQVSPCGPRASLHAHQPTCAVRVALLRYAPRVGLSYRLSPGNRSPGHCLPDAVSVSPNLVPAQPVGLGRREEFHPPAPFAAAPALLEACGYSVCSAPGWRPGACRGGAPACPFGRVCLQLAICSLPPLLCPLEEHRADRRACEATHAFAQALVSANLAVLSTYSFASRGSSSSMEHHYVSLRSTKSHNSRAACAYTKYLDSWS